MKANESLMLMVLVQFAYQQGQEHGALAERERRDSELEQRVTASVDKLAQETPELWETELDV
jgi:hypothetical protein